MVNANDSRVVQERFQALIRQIGIIVYKISLKGNSWHPAALHPVLVILDGYVHGITHLDLSDIIATMDNRKGA